MKLPARTSSAPAWEYRGRWALITGASAGIGEIFAEQLASRGMNLVLSARRADRLTALADRLAREFSIETVVVAEDLSEPGAASALWNQAADGRPIHLLVNNAGFGAQGDLHELDLELQSQMVRLNCVALLELAHLALGPMRRRADGGIINVSSIAAFQPVPGLAVYAASKAFVLSLSEALWSENRHAGVRVLALCPGRTPTEFQAVAGTGSAVGTFGERSPLQVVQSGLSALEQGRSYQVPGLENYLATWLVRILPRSAITRLLRSAVRKRGAPSA
ncbi:SDR family oxidoreductase [soil metagenome]